jgi:hypothetical protein
MSVKVQLKKSIKNSCALCERKKAKMTMDGPVQNANPVIYETQIVESSLQVREDDYNESVADPIAAAEIFGATIMTSSN